MDIRETCIDKVQGEDYARVYTCEIKYMNKLKELQKKYPNEVTLEAWDDWGIHAKVPVSWFKFVSPKRKVNMTEERKQKLATNMAKARKKKT